MVKRKKQGTGGRRRGVVHAGAIRTPTEPIDPEIEEEFHATDGQSRSGGRRLVKTLSQHTSESPELTAGDVDAAWDRPDVGEEAPGGSVPTPDQDVVEEIGQAVGLTFEDDEEVDAPGKLDRRDRNRWELRPASAEDYHRRQREARIEPEAED